MSKDFKTHEEMVAILNKRGLATDTNSIDILRQHNYYQLINGYKDHFLSERGVNERYKEGTSLNDIYSLYLFDRELRIVFLKGILQVESTMKNVISHCASKYYKDDPEFYLDVQNYTPSSKKSGNVQKTLAKLENCRNSSKQSPKHYREKYGIVPFWVLAKDLTFGNLSFFYELLAQPSIQNDIAHQLHSLFMQDDDQASRLTVGELRRDLRILVEYRNICAHDERFYCHKFGKVHVANNRPADVSTLLTVLKKYLPAHSYDALNGDLTREVTSLAEGSGLNLEVAIPAMQDIGFELYLNGERVS